MRVKCVSVQMQELPANYFQPIGRYHPEAKTNQALTMGKEYTVYAVECWQGQVYYYLADDGYSDHPSRAYPNQQPAPLFSIVDNQIPEDWCCQVHEKGLSISFDEWINDVYFYDKLLNEEANVLAIWQQRKTLMDSGD